MVYISPVVFFFLIYKILELKYQCPLSAQLQCEDGPMISNWDANIWSCRFISGFGVFGLYFFFLSNDEDIAIVFYQAEAILHIHVQPTHMRPK